MGNTSLTPPLTESQSLGVQVSRIVASVPSILGATFIVQHVLRSRKRSRTSKHLLLSMSIMDLLFSCVNACSSFIVPKEFSQSISFASGNWATCQASGVLGQGSSLSSVVYNAMLTLCHFLTVRYGWTERKLKKVEKLMHAIPLLVGWGTAMLGLVFNQYNPTILGCLVGGPPQEPLSSSCEDGFSTESAPACTSTRPSSSRSLAEDIVPVVLLYAWVWFVFFFLLVSMILIYSKIAKVNEASPFLDIPSNPEQEESAVREPATIAISPSGQTPKRSSSSGKGRYYDYRRSRSGSIRSSSEPTSLDRLKRQFVMQALLCCALFAMTWFFRTLDYFLVTIVHLPTSIPVLFLGSILNSLQGFWNAFLYVRPRYLRYKRRQLQRRATGRGIITTKALGGGPPLSVKKEQQDEQEEDEPQVVGGDAPGNDQGHGQEDKEDALEGC